MPQLQGSYLPSQATVYSSAAAEETKQLKAGPGLLLDIIITNFNAAARYVYIFDSLTASGALVVPPIPLAALADRGSIAALNPMFAVPFQIGCFVAVSSTGATYTASATNDIRFTAYTKG